MQNVRFFCVSSKRKYTPEPSEWSSPLKQAEPKKALMIRPSWLETSVEQCTPLTPSNTNIFSGVRKWFLHASAFASEIHYDAEQNVMQRNLNPIPQHAEDWSAMHRTSEMTEQVLLVAMVVCLQWVKTRVHIHMSKSIIKFPIKSYVQKD